MPGEFTVYRDLLTGIISTLGWVTRGVTEWQGRSRSSKVGNPDTALGSEWITIEVVG